MKNKQELSYVILPLLECFKKAILREDTKEEEVVRGNILNMVISYDLLVDSLFNVRRVEPSEALKHMISRRKELGVPMRYEDEVMLQHSIEQMETLVSSKENQEDLDKTF
jgi:hypothetical protein